MSSPFRASHRRTRSYSSSSPPITRADSFRAQQILSPAFARASQGYGFAADDLVVSAAPASSAQPPERRDGEAWRCTKRARREPSAQSEDADMDTDDEPVPSSPMVSPDATMQRTMSTSAPSTPLLASTSEAFQFFPSRTSTGLKGAPPVFSVHTPTADNTSGVHIGQGPALAQAQSDAFTDLRRTVTEAGECFVRRMREFEETNRTRPAPPAHLRVSTKDADAGSAPRRIRNRGRKRRSPASARDLDSAHRVVHERVKESNDAGDDSDDVEIRSSYASGSDDDPMWSPSKKRAVSLCAIGGAEQDARPHPYSLPFAIPLRKGARSSSPSVCTNSSDDDEDDRAGKPRPLKVRRSRYSVPSSGTSRSPPLSFSFPSTSNNSSIVSLPMDSQPAANCFGLQPASGLPLHSARSSKSTEKAVAALSLAIANGAGSVSDYEALREAQDLLSIDDSEAGSLWN